MGIDCRKRGFETEATGALVLRQDPDVSDNLLPSGPLTFETTVSAFKEISERRSTVLQA
jgi:hypothetical protein